MLQAGLVWLKAVKARKMERWILTAFLSLQGLSNRHEENRMGYRFLSFLFQSQNRLQAGLVWLKAVKARNMERWILTAFFSLKGLSNRHEENRMGYRFFSFLFQSKNTLQAGLVWLKAVKARNMERWILTAFLSLKGLSNRHEENSPHMGWWAQHRDIAEQWEREKVCQWMCEEFLYSRFNS